MEMVQMVGDYMRVFRRLKGQLISIQLKQPKIRIYNLFGQKCNPLASETSIIDAKLTLDLNLNIKFPEMLVQMRQSIIPYAFSINFDNFFPIFVLAMQWFNFTFFIRIFGVNGK